MSRANTGRFAGFFGMSCERELLLAMQKVEGSNPFSRSRKGLHLQAFFRVISRVVRLHSTGLGWVGALLLLVVPERARVDGASRRSLLARTAAARARRKIVSARPRVP